MARPRDAHPLGKVSEGERGLEITFPPGSGVRGKLDMIATLHGKTPTAWARDALEKLIEGEWVFIQRRVISAPANQQGGKPPEESPDA